MKPQHSKGTSFDEGIIFMRARDSPIISPQCNILHEPQILRRILKWWHERVHPAGMTLQTRVTR